MKREILKALRAAGDGEFVSGQKLCAALGVTRQAVWKSISALRKDGFAVEGASNKGYRLTSSPDRIYAFDFLSRMEDGSFCAEAESHESIDSTNLRAKELAQLGAAEGTVVLAQRQTAGRGRMRRVWESDDGGIFMSIIVKPNINPPLAPMITIVAALAAADAVNEESGAGAAIKWPNDIVLDGKKLCGILTEMSSEMNRIDYVVVGIGVNANNEKFEGDLEKKAVSLYMHDGRKVDRTRLAARIATRFGEYYKEFVEAGDLKPFVKRYDAMLVNRGKKVRALYGMREDFNPDFVKEGIAVGIDERGALLIKTDDGVERVSSGEVSVRGMSDYV